ncbi:MAG: Ig-like domain-containing protein [Christensenellales bacterium]|jgi:small-conductance mechanosensitive channel
MKTKRFSIFIAIVMVLAQMFALVPLANAAGGRDVITLIPPLVEITSSSFAVFDSDDEPITDFSNIPQDANVSISYSFKVNDADNPSDDVVGSDYFTISLPEELTSIASFTPITDRIFTTTVDGETYTIGNLNITVAGIATFTFHDDMQHLSDVTINYTVDGSFDDGKIGDGDSVSFQLDAGGEIYTIVFEDELR